MPSADQFAAALEPIVDGLNKAQHMRKAHVSSGHVHLGDDEIHMPLIVDESTCLGLSLELPTDHVHTKLDWLANLATLTLENIEMELCCLVFLFPKPLVYPSPLYTLLDRLCAYLKQDDINMQCMPVATYGGWQLVKPNGLQLTERQ